MKKAAQAFEAVFLRQMIGAMRSASLDEGLGDSSATEQFRDLADARTADSMSQGHGLGIAEMLMRQFSGSTVAGNTTTTPAAPIATGTNEDKK
jgi:flagellar protein FlgJ